MTVTREGNTVRVEWRDDDGALQELVAASWDNGEGVDLGQSGSFFRLALTHRQIAALRIGLAALDL